MLRCVRTPNLDASLDRATSEENEFLFHRSYHIDSSFGWTSKRRLGFLAMGVVQISFETSYPHEIDRYPFSRAPGVALNSAPIH